MTSYYIYKKEDFEKMNVELSRVHCLLTELSLKKEYIDELMQFLTDNLKCDYSYLMAEMRSGWKPVLFANEYIDDFISLYNVTNNDVYIIIDEYGKKYTYNNFLSIISERYRDKNSKHDDFNRICGYGMEWGC